MALSPKVSWYVILLPAIVSLWSLWSLSHGRRTGCPCFFERISMVSPRNDRLSRHAGDGLIGLEAITALLADTALHVSLVRDALARAYGERSPGPALDPLQRTGPDNPLATHDRHQLPSRLYAAVRATFPPGSRSWQHRSRTSNWLFVVAASLARRLPDPEHPAPGAGTGRVSLAR